MEQKRDRPFSVAQCIHSIAVMLLLLLPDDLLSSILSHWIDPEKDLRTVAEEVLDKERFRELVAQRGVRVHAAQVLSSTCLDWLTVHAVPAELWKTEGTFYERWWGSGQEWRCNGQLHRDGDLPAVVYAEGRREWWLHGKRHREDDQPAVIYANGTQEWRQHDEIHREDDQPAIVDADGSQEWWQHGKRHREDGKPAIVYASGTRVWFRHGQYLRSEG